MAESNVSERQPDIRKITLAGAIVTLGIVFGDLGTSPLYTMRAILAGAQGNNSELLIYGSISCIFWTLTLSTTIKYVLIALRADNNGEGGIFALFALIKGKSTWAVILTMIGGAALLADGVLGPAITITAAMEGLRLFNPDIPVIPIVLIVIAGVFFIQQFGTNFVGRSFGPIMVAWFLMLGVLGFSQVLLYPEILRAISPEYAYVFLKEYPGAFILLGAVFLATTGAEALYANLGHCGRSNIRITWIFVKVMLLLNYFGQGAWLMRQGFPGSDVNPFFSIMPSWFLMPGLIFATAAAIIASQAIISGSFTLIGEAVSLNFWPKMRILHPTEVAGQVYLPSVNWYLWIIVSVIVFSFRESTNMNAAYGIAIALTEIMTTFLLSYYLFQKGVNHRIVLIMMMIFLTIESTFLIANLFKFNAGGWFSLVLALAYFVIMFGWYFGRKIKNRYITFADLEKYLDLFRDLSKDESVPRFATNLVYIIRANRTDQVESKVIYSIFHRQPKRADTYWFLHVNRVNDPNSFSYQVTKLIPGLLIRIDFDIGFKVDPKVNLYFREVLEDLVRSGEIKLESSYESLRKHDFPGDFKFIIIDRILSRDFALSNWENFIMAINGIVRKLSITEIRNLNLDSTNTIVEQVPITIDQPVDARIKRIE